MQPNTPDTHIPRLDSINAQANQVLKRENEMPQGYVRNREGIIVPERFRSPSTEITIGNRVNIDMFEELSEKLQKLETNNTVFRGMEISFSSFGGEVTPGFGVHDRITAFGRKHNVPITITGYGPIMSIGALIIQAGDIRRMPKNSRMLLHPISSKFSGYTNEIQQQALETAALQRIYTEIISERVTKAGKDMSPEKVNQLMEANNNQGTRLTSAEALDLGLIDEVV